MKTERLRVQNLNLCLENKMVLQNASFTVFDEETVCLFIPDEKVRYVLGGLLRNKYRKYEGTFYINGIEEKSPWKDFYVVGKVNNLIQNMDIAENLFLTSDTMYFCDFLRKKKMYRQTKEILKKAHLGHISPQTPVYMLNAIEQHCIELLKGISRGKKFLLLDDITGIYRGYEIERLKYLLHFLKKEGGITILYMADKMAEILSIMDRVVVIQDGTVLRSEACDKDSIYRKIISILPPQRNRQLRAGMSDHLLGAVEWKNGSRIFEIEEGEVIGVYDPMWECVPEILMCLKKREPEKSKVRIYKNRKEVTVKDEYDMLKQGIGLIEEKNQEHLIFYNMNLTDNVTLMAEKEIMTGPFFSSSKKKCMAQEALKLVDGLELMELYGGKMTMPKLSGNQEMKIAIARLLCVSPKLIFWMNPQLGFTDVSMNQLGEVLHSLKSHGVSCVLFSRMQSLEGLCDRTVSVGMK